MCGMEACRGDKVKLSKRELVRLIILLLSCYLFSEYVYMI